MKWFSAALVSAVLFSAAAADVTKGGFGAAKDGAPKKTEERQTEQKPKRTSYPFYGTLDSVNVKEKIITLRGKEKNRVIAYGSDTRILRNNAPAKVGEAQPGERVSGSVQKDASGKELALTIRLGSNPLKK